MLLLVCTARVVARDGGKLVAGNHLTFTVHSARSKLRLIFLDLIFIVFNSANLSLAFEGLHGSGGVCDTRRNGHDLICQRQKGLASVLLIALIAWLLNFSTSVLR